MRGLAGLPAIAPFEICSIRPPTENASLTFRLTRNCGWNRCKFCPVYKLGARFSRRSMAEVQEDVDRARAIDDLLTSLGAASGSTFQGRIDDIIEELEACSPVAASAPGATRVEMPADTPADEEDERLEWFSSWFRETPTIRDSVSHILTWRHYGSGTCFIGDANSLILSGAFFLEALGYIKERFPGISRFTIYGRTRSAARKKPEELRAFAAAGLNRIHFGIESGSGTVLRFMDKGETPEDHVEGCLKTREAGISPSVYVMPGLGGRRWSGEHAAETARVLTAAKPDYVRLRTLEIFPKTALAAAVKTGEFVEATEEEVAREIRALVADIETPTVIVSDSASNLLDVNGRLPGDREAMLSVIDSYLSLGPREKLEFSLSSRLQSLIGQYGGVSRDVMAALMPFVEGGAVTTERMGDGEIIAVTRLIRSKLMP